MGLRSKQIIIRATSEEHLRMRARAGKMRLSPWLRAAALDAIPPTVPEINQNALAELHRIGSNLNQLARHANSVGSRELDIAAAREQIAELRLALIEASK